MTSAFWKIGSCVYGSSRAKTSSLNKSSTGDVIMEKKNYQGCMTYLKKERHSWKTNIVSAEEV